MEKILSQEEIDALLKGIETGKVDTTSAASPEPPVSSFDFASQDRIVRGRMPTLEILNNFLARLLRNPISLMLRRTVDIVPQALQLIKYAEFTKTLTIPSSLHVFKMDPLRGHSLLVLDSKLVFSFIDIFLGGSGKMGSLIEGRDFTAIESKLIHKIVTVVLAELEKVWNTVHPVTVQYIRSEFNPQFASVVPPGDLVLVLPFAVESEQFGGLVTVCIPYSTLEPIKTKLYSVYQADRLELDRGWIERWVEQLRNTEVEVSVELAHAMIPARKILRLKVGDILPLGKDPADPLLARVEGVPKFVGKAGIYGTNKAFQVDQRINPL
jgi:flagellar motor switch protein FliM